MTDDFPEGVAMLRQAYEMGILDKDAYRSAMEVLGVSETGQARVPGSAGDTHGGINTPGREPEEEDPARD